jgi:ATP-dependent Clp protease ATP-binding subunit ClpA
MANQGASRLRHESIGTEHLLLGLVKEGSGDEANVLKNLGVDLLTVSVEVEKSFRACSRSSKLAQGGFAGWLARLFGLKGR